MWNFLLYTKMNKQNETKSNITGTRTKQNAHEKRIFFLSFVRHTTNSTQWSILPCICLILWRINIEIRRIFFLFSIISNGKWNSCGSEIVNRKKKKKINTIACLRILIWKSKWNFSPTNPRRIASISGMTNLILVREIRLILMARQWSSLCRYWSLWNVAPFTLLSLKFFLLRRKLSWSWPRSYVVVTVLGYSVYTKKCIE